jgi:hypothetical protein
MAARLSASRAGLSLPPGRFLVLISVKRLSGPQGHSAAGRIRSVKKCNHFIGNRIRDLPACRVVLQNQLRYRVPPCPVRVLSNSQYVIEGKWPIDSSQLLVSLGVNLTTVSVRDYVYSFGGLCSISRRHRLAFQIRA